MKRIYDTYFRISEGRKIGDRVLLSRIALSTITMVVCLLLMSLSAYAYFSHQLTSDYSELRGANFEADVIVLRDADGVEIALEKVNPVEFRVLLEAGNYTVTVKKAPPERSSAKTGFCIVTTLDTDYHTAQIGRDGDKDVTEISFALEVKGTDKAPVTFLCQWGTSSHYAAYVENGDVDPLYITDDETIVIGTVGTLGVDETETKKGSSSSTTTTTTTTNETEKTTVTESATTTATTTTAATTTTKAPTVTETEKTSVTTETSAPAVTEN